MSFIMMWGGGAVVSVIMTQQYNSSDILPKTYSNATLA